MKKGGSKNKGNAFEREVAKKLSLWLTDNVLSDAVWRSDTSGGRSTLRIKKGEKKTQNMIDNAGDLKSVIPQGQYDNLDRFFNQFCVELKFYKEINMRIPLKGHLVKFFDQCLQQQAQTQKDIFLVVKSNRKKTLIFTSIYIKCGNRLSLYIYKDKGFHCYLLDDFFVDTKDCDCSSRIPGTFCFLDGSLYVNKTDN